MRPAESGQLAIDDDDQCHPAHCGPQHHTTVIQAHTSRGCPIHEAARSWRAARSPGTSSPPTSGRAAPLCRPQSAAARPSAALQQVFGHRRRRASRARRRRQRVARRPSARRRLARRPCRAGSPAPGSCGAQGGAQTTAHRGRREGGRRGQSIEWTLREAASRLLARLQRSARVQPIKPAMEPT